MIGPVENVKMSDGRPGNVSPEAVNEAATPPFSSTSSPRSLIDTKVVVPLPKLSSTLSFTSSGSPSFSLIAVEVFSNSKFPVSRWPSTSSAALVALTFSVDVAVSNAIPNVPVSLTPGMSTRTVAAIEPETPAAAIVSWPSPLLTTTKSRDAVPSRNEKFLTETRVTVVAGTRKPAVLTPVTRSNAKSALTWLPKRVSERPVSSTRR